MKKLLLSLGSVAAIVAPVAAVVACGDDKAAFTLSSELSTDKTTLTVTVAGKDAKIDDLTKEIAAKGDAKTTTIKFKVGTKELQVTITEGKFNVAADVKTAITSTIGYNTDLGKILARSSANELKEAPDYATIITTKASSATKLSDLANSIKLAIDDFEIPAAAKAQTGATAKIEKVEAPKTALTADGEATYKVTLNEGKGALAKLIVDVKVHFGAATNGGSQTTTTNGGSQTTTTNGGSQTNTTTYIPSVTAGVKLANTDWDKLTADKLTWSPALPAGVTADVKVKPSQTQPTAQGKITFVVTLSDANLTVANSGEVQVDVEAPTASSSQSTPNKTIAAITVTPEASAVISVPNADKADRAKILAEILAEAKRLTIANFKVEDDNTPANTLDAAKVTLDTVEGKNIDLTAGSEKVTFTVKLNGTAVEKTVDVNITFA